MKILFYFFVTVHFSNVDCRECPTHCFCYKWMNMTRTDCVGINLYNTFIAGYSPHDTQVLDISYNVISILHGNEFQDANLRQLKELRVSNNKLHKIDKLSFNGLKHLEYLDLSHNTLEYINPNTFTNNPNLKVLNVSHNPLTLKADNPFLINPPPLTILNLAESNLKGVSPHFFTGLEYLQVLNLSNNHIRQLHSHDLEIMRNLKFLDVSRNDLSCIDKSMTLIQWLRDRKIIFQPFCQTSSKVITSVTLNEEINIIEESHQRISNGTVTENTLTDEKNIFKKIIQFFQLMPSIYAMICGIQIGILFGALPTYLYMRKINKVPSLPLQSRSRNPERIRMADRASRFINNDSGNSTFDLIPLRTPPGTPPSPYHSRLTLPSNFSLTNT